MHLTTNIAVSEEQMEERHEQKELQKSINRKTVIWFAVAAAVILLIAQIESVKSTLNWLGGMLSPIILGVIFAYIINPFNVFVQKRFFKLFSKVKRMRPKARTRASNALGIICSIIALLGIIVLLLFLIIPEFLESFAKLIEIAPSFVRDAGEWLGSQLSADNPFSEHLGELIDGLVAQLTSWIGGELSGIIGGLLEGAMSVVTFFVNFILSIIVCVYALIEKKSFLGQFKKIIYSMFSISRANDILDVARYGNSVFGKFVSGKLITSSIVGIITFLFMSVAGMQYALLSAGIIAITNVIPFFGPFIGGIPTAFIVLLTNARHGIIYIIFLIVLQQIEGNIIEPMIMEDKTGLSKFWISVAILFCGGVFGLAGMVFSVPIFAILFYVIKLAVERSLKRKGLPVASCKYQDVGEIDPESHELLPPPSTDANQKHLRELVLEWKSRIFKKNKSDECEGKEKSNNEE